MKVVTPVDQPALSEQATATIEDIGATLNPGEDKEIKMYVCKDDAGAVTVKDEDEYTATSDAEVNPATEPAVSPVISKRPKAVGMAMAGM